MEKRDDEQFSVIGLLGKLYSFYIQQEMVASTSMAGVHQPLMCAGPFW